MHPVIKLLVQRIALGLLLLFAVSAVIFLGVEALPGDTAQAILGQSATPVALENLREKLGLNEPALTRYFSWLGGVLTGDLGTALTNGADIATAIGSRLGNTLFLAGTAAVISVPLAIILGLVTNAPRAAELIAIVGNVIAFEVADGRDDELVACLLLEREELRIERSFFSGGNDIGLIDHRIARELGKVLRGGGGRRQQQQPGQGCRCQRTEKRGHAHLIARSRPLAPDWRWG